MGDGTENTNINTVENECDYYRYMPVYEHPETAGEFNYSDERKNH